MISKIKSTIRLWHYISLEEEGATAVEYAILASAVAAVIAGVVFALGLSVKGLFSEFYNKFIG